MDDLISRQAALSEVHKSFYEFFDICEDDEETTITSKDEQLLEINKVITTRIKNLPTAEPELVRCKDCKWYGRADKRRFYRGMDCLQHRIDTIVPDKDFCSRAERRSDE